MKHRQLTNKFKNSSNSQKFDSAKHCLNKIQQIVTIRTLLKKNTIDSDNENIVSVKYNKQIVSRRTLSELKEQDKCDFVTDIKWMIVE